MKKQIVRRSVNLAAASFDDARPPILQRIYASRGVTTERQLDRSLSHLLSFHALKGIDDAVQLLVNALQQQQSILIVGDFDADGATSSAVAVKTLTDFGAKKVNFLVPNRFEFGYGLTPEIVTVAQEYSPDLIVTVDNGISSISGVAAANAAGIKVLVTDHHLPGSELPDAAAIVNPNQQGCEFPSKNAAGVAVIFYVMSALRAKLRELKWFELQNISEPNMASYLDLVALGTVADVVPLDENNRRLVYHGLRRMRAGKALPGINALIEIAGRNIANLTASDLGFAVGPRLNAAGRLDDMALGINCLLCPDPLLAKEMALQLDELNQDRKQIESGMQQQALVELDAMQLLDENAESLPFGLCFFKSDWHQGVIGILASRIKERVNRPVIAFAEADNGELKGSARSIPGFHIRDALDAIAAKHPDLLSKFGGHAMAAGMSLAKEHYDAFRQAFADIAKEMLTEADLVGEVLSDGELASNDFSMELAQTLQEAGPWGQHFLEPVFDGHFHVVQQRIVGEKHLKLVLSMDGADRGAVFDAIAFNVDLGVWPNQAQRAKVAYKLDINEFRGKRNLQLMVEHLEPVE